MMTIKLLNLKNLKTRILFALMTLLCGLTSLSVRVFAQDTTTDVTNVVLAWMPLIITFAMLGMVLGLLKKFGKF
ncbi:MAG: hypothetical protein QW270_05680 [Candidatus Bathyarchaeia archaeon]